MFIYKITNKVNNKIYIGQTIGSIQKRFKRHINDAEKGKLNTHLARAIRKYGEKSFIIEQIDTAKTQKELTEKEYYYINLFNCVKNGYNETNNLIKCGGNTYVSKTKEELSLIKNKISKTKEGKKNPNHKSIKIKNIKTGEELFFDTVKSCKDFFGEKHHRFITNRVLNKTVTLYKGVWNISYIDVDYQDKSTKIRQNRSNIKVIIKNNEKVLFFHSIRQMCEELNIPRNKIKQGIDIEINDYKIFFE